jgi:putative (di)nucleoside polyphosphate hydrolase
LLQLKSQDSAVNLNSSGHPEFDDWRWVSYWYPVRQVVSFKRDVYRKVMKEFATTALALQTREPSRRRGRQRAAG